MSKFLFRTFVLLGLLFSSLAHAGDRGALEEAKAMSLRAADLLRQEDRTRRFPFSMTRLVHYDNTGLNVAHGANAALIGKQLIDLKDTDGKPLIRELVSVEDQGFVEYKSPNPITKKIEQKATYVVRVGEYLVGVGTYK
jgi:cytochrome c